jgi:hypothetical protein
MNRDINHIQGDERALASSWSDRLFGSWRYGVDSSSSRRRKQKGYRRPVSRLRFPYLDLGMVDALDGSISKDVRYHGVQVSFTIHRRVVERWFFGTTATFRWVVVLVELKARGRKVHHLVCSMVYRVRGAEEDCLSRRRRSHQADSRWKRWRTAVFDSVRGRLVSILRFDWRALGLAFWYGWWIHGFWGAVPRIGNGKALWYEGFRGLDACVVDTRLMIGGRASLSGVLFMGLPRSLGLSFSTGVVLLLSRIVSGIVMSCIGFGSAAFCCAYGVTGARYPSPCGMLDRRMVVLGIIRQLQTKSLPGRDVKSGIVVSWLWVVPRLFIPSSSHNHIPIQLGRQSFRAFLCLILLRPRTIPHFSNAWTHASHTPTSPRHAIELHWMTGTILAGWFHEYAHNR